jgi:biopolymer transport protein ExbD
MRLRAREKENPEIPTCSMADIAFLLIVFFMLTSVFKAEQGFRVILPKAMATKKLPKRNIAHIWVSKDGVISIDDNIVKKSQVGAIMARKEKVNPNLITSIIMDKDGVYGDLSDVFEGLKDASALKVSLATLKERGG